MTIFYNKWYFYCTKNFYFYFYVFLYDENYNFIVFDYESIVFIEAIIYVFKKYKPFFHHCAH